jgi:hypothetical protein
MLIIVKRMGNGSRELMFGKAKPLPSGTKTQTVAINWDISVMLINNGFPMKTWRLASRHHAKVNRLKHVTKTATSAKHMEDGSQET